MAGAVVAGVLAARRWQLRWGATGQEARGPLPGDDLITGADLVATRAITIGAAADQVWPWIAQLGQGRGGFYSYDFLENLIGCDIHSADTIVPEWLAVTAGLGTLVYAIVETETHPWGSATTLSLLGAAAVLLAIFALIELRLASAPLVRFALFRSRSVSGANLVMFLVGAAFFSMWYFLSLYLQNVLGYSALWAGLAFLPMGITIIIGAQASSRIMPRTGVRPLLLAGTVLAACGFGWLSAISPDSSYWAHVFGFSISTPGLDGPELIGLCYDGG